MTPPRAQLISAHVFISELNQVSRKPLATAAKETVAVQDQRLSFVRNAFRDLVGVPDV
jgi:hypothetical protein